MTKTELLIKLDDFKEAALKDLLVEVRFARELKAKRLVEEYRQLEREYTSLETMARLLPDTTRHMFEALNIQAVKIYRRTILDKETMNDD